MVSMQHTGSNGISSLHPRVSTCTFNFDYNNLLMSGPSVNILKSNFKSNHFPVWHQLFHYKGFLHWHEQKILESKYLAELDFRCYSNDVTLLLFHLKVMSINFLMCWCPLEAPFELLVQAHISPHTMSWYVPLKIFY